MILFKRFQKKNLFHTFLFLLNRKKREIIN